MPYPFEIPFEKVLANMDKAVDAVFSCLQSEFMVLPKGKGFVEFPIFEKGYEALRKSSGGFGNVCPDTVMPVVLELPISLIVLRTMLGFTPPEWAYVAARKTGTEIDQGFARTLDREIRLEPLKVLKCGGLRLKRLNALIETACSLLQEKPPSVQKERIPRPRKPILLEVSRVSSVLRRRRALLHAPL